MTTQLKSNKTFPVLETERLVLREVTPADAGDMLIYLSDPDVMKYYGLAPFESEQDALDEIAWYSSIFQKKTGIRWGITLKGTEQVIGSCGFLNWSSQHYRSEVGAELSKEHWNKGIMTEAFQAILQYGFDHMELVRIQGLMELENIASWKLCEKNGFIREGLLRKYEYTVGKFDDMYMYSLLKEDFLARS
ncbi:GNAT family N-acetyltransferase [Thermoactinomyces sp. DSM 45892]|uniref:GNAT family N-acetyltransferase n=1 Tax=Thermoactinomyces sp. DSM 45892 TaxID=1882753 RepID=UPI00089A55E2|nr:GNAT family protein [Thermoactinomyces sp. DSM 45892]SDY18000.1 ribosomal-protein-alanine N-acetyltransferase [Thermoactinomyces sp. DSM 45892]